jgi:DNA-binding PadR family transcriptional regulator
MMQELERRSGGVWRPSPGSVYPALQQLEDEGLIRSGERGGQKLFELTDAGREHLRERDPDAPPPWEEMTSDFGEVAFALGSAFREAASAFAQVMRTGSEAQMARAREVLSDARRDLYRILADGETEGHRGSEQSGSTGQPAREQGESERGETTTPEDRDESRGGRDDESGTGGAIGG